MTNITDTDTTKSTTLASYTYGYDTASQLTSYQDNSGNSLTYSYDKVGELTGAAGTLAGSSYTAGYNYDLNGNRTSTGTDAGGSLTSATYTTTTGNELASDGTYTYTYDKDGNTLTQTDIATGTVTYYTWDYENRLTEEKVENSQGQVLEDETFTYDVNGNRIGVSLNGVQQLYTVYDGSNPYMDFNGSGQLTQRYLTNPNALSQFYGQVSASNAVQWYLTDNLGSIRQVVNSTGTSLDVITYDPYGNIVSQTNAANAPRFLFAGGEYDPLTGEYRYEHRVDKPLDGDWLSEDPIGQGTNWYVYADNSPTDAVDPTGLKVGDGFWSWDTLLFLVGLETDGTGGVRSLKPGIHEIWAKDTATDIAIAMPQTRVPALIGGSYDLIHQGLGNVTDWRNGNPQRGIDTSQTQNMMLAGALLGPISRYRTVQFGLAGYATTNGVSELSNGDVEQGLFDLLIGGAVCPRPGALTTVTNRRTTGSGGSRTPRV